MSSPSNSNLGLTVSFLPIQYVDQVSLNRADPHAGLLNHILSRSNVAAPTLCFTLVRVSFKKSCVSEANLTL